MLYDDGVKSGVHTSFAMDVELSGLISMVAAKQNERERKREKVSDKTPSRF